MKKNLNTTERIIRVFISIILLIMGFFLLNDIIAYLIIFIAILIFLSSLFAWCKIYEIFGINYYSRDPLKINKKDIKKVIKEKSFEINSNIEIINPIKKKEN